MRERNKHRHFHGGHHGHDYESSSGAGRRGFGRGLGRIFAPGDLRLMLLSLLSERAHHGYELMKAIEDEFEGAYTPSAGSVYPTLTLLEETGLIAGQVDGVGKRRYEATEAGRSFLLENRETVDAVRRRMKLTARAVAGQRPPEAIFQAMQTLRTALSLHGGAWSDVEIKRVASIIEHAASEIQAPEGST